MKSPEGLVPTKTEIEKVEQEITPKSPEIEVAEISNEDLEQHTVSAESHIEQQTAEVLPEGEKRLESSSSSMNVSPETLDSTKQEFGLDTKLQEVQAEADQIASEAKSEIASVAEKPEPEKNVEVKQQTPEEIKEERRMGIVKELEKEWETKNGPMERPMTKAEIEGTKSWEIINGRKWDGGTTRMTDAASEFFFDHRGMGKSSVPSRAGKILAERFPEYAQKTEQPPQNEPKRAEEKIPVAEVSKSNYETEKTSTGKLTEVFKQAGVESRTIKIENGGEFSEAIILKKQEIPTEKMARIYRGINHLDSSVLEQIPYAMRTENGTGKPMALDNVRQEVDNLAKNPTYENLLAYADKVRQNLSPDEVRRMDEDLSRIENGILEGYSTRKELIFKQIEHGGGWGESGITPYVSASFDPYEAAGYGNEGLIVIDVPLSELEDFRADGSEVNIKGALDKKYITAILPRKRGEAKDDKEKINQQVYQALQKVYESAEIPLYGDEEMRSEREKKITEDTESDKEQQKKDAERVRQKRVEKLAKVFPEMKINFQDAKEKSVELETDPYTKVKRDIFDQYKTRLEKIGRNGRNIEDYEFSESEYGERKKFDREKTSDIMLVKLRELTLRLEEKEEERNRR
jgi:hypothetical protein